MTLVLESLADLLDHYCNKYENIFIMGGATPADTNITKGNDLTNIMKEKTCFKSKEGKCIDLIITNCFKNTNALETGISDHHLLISAFTKMPYE